MRFKRFYISCLLLWGTVAFSGDRVSSITIGGGPVGSSYNAIATNLAKATAQSKKHKKKPRAKSSGGSLTNIKALKHGEFSVGIAQADVAEAAFRGVGPFKSEGQFKDLRTIARLYPEYIHLIVKADSPFKSLADLKGKHVGLGSAGSGTLEDSIKVLQAYGLRELDLKGHYGTIAQTIEGFKKGKIDAFFYVTSNSSIILKRLGEKIPFKLLAIDGKARDHLLAENHTMVRAVLQGPPYSNSELVETLSVSAQLLVKSGEDEESVYALTQNLWEIQPQKDGGEAPSLDFTLALNNLAAPLHPGAEKYYRERHSLQN